MNSKSTKCILTLTLIAIIASVLPAEAGNRGTTPPPPPPPAPTPVTSNL